MILRVVTVAATSVTLLGIASASIAAADPNTYSDDPSLSSENDMANAAIFCHNLRINQTVDGTRNAVTEIMKVRATTEQAAKLAAFAIRDICPDMRPLMDNFTTSVHSDQQAPAMHTLTPNVPTVPVPPLDPSKPMVPGRIN